MHASTTIELDRQLLACATLHAKSWCLFVCHLYTLPGKEGPGSTTPALPGSGSASGLMLATAWPGSKICGNHVIQNIVRRAVKGWGVHRQPLQPQPLLSAVLQWGLAQESWQICLRTRHVW